MLWRLALAAAAAAAAVALLDHDADCELVSDEVVCGSVADDVFAAVTLTACRATALSVLGVAVLLDDSLDSAKTNGKSLHTSHTNRNYMEVQCSLQLPLLTGFEIISL